ncbi:PREDICTED: uncharacterized protein LOC109476931 [Branchiostoma belcheri]|uniref:Uncharacterized protein LOC109476931 n=1 Tax=Branchiostoma belcheri TaxID=7741 RepID=A0A6P4ZV77_BRABE|nr:PREDICTED: uncharacterized protein LOC109476931 [Branchiostoma belcheri]
MWSKTLGSPAVALVILLLVTGGSPNEPPGTTPTTGPAEILTTSAGTVTGAEQSIDESGVPLDGGLNSGDHDASAPEEAGHPSPVPTDTNTWVVSTTTQNTIAEESVDQTVSDDKLNTSFPLDPPENSSLSNHQEDGEKETAEDSYDIDGFLPVWGPLQTLSPEFEVQEETGTDKPQAATDIMSVPTEENKAGEETFGGGFGWGPLLPPPEDTNEATIEVQTPSVPEDGDKTGEETFGGGFGWGPLLPPQEPTEAPAEAQTPSVSKDGDKTEEQLTGEETFGGGFGWGPLLPPEEPKEDKTEASTPSVLNEGDKTGEETFGGGFGWGPLLPPEEPKEDKTEASTPSVLNEGDKTGEETFGGGFGWGPLLPPEEPKEDKTEASTPSVPNESDKTGEETFGGGFGWGPLLPPQEPNEAPAEAPTPSVPSEGDKAEDEAFGGGFAIGWGPLLPPREPTEAPIETPTTRISEQESGEQFGVLRPPPPASMGGGPIGWGPLLPPRPTEPPLFRDVLNQEYGRKYPAVAPCIEKAMCTSMLDRGGQIDMLQTRCHCDIQCRDFRDCCVDIDDVEPLNTTGSPGPAAIIHPDSCRWRCGRTALFSTVSCGCDAGCKTNNTCCVDYVDVCVTGSARNSRQDVHEPLQCGHAPNATDHYWMVASCPERYPASRVRTLCEAPGDSTDDLLLQVPVVENVTGVPYRNMFCGICNEAQEMVTWETHVLCTPGLDEARVRTNLSGVLGEGLCTRQAFRPSSTLPARRCFPPVQPKPSLRSSSMCNATECRRLTAMVYQKQTGQPFRNGYCLGCVYDIDTVASADTALSCKSLDEIANHQRLLHLAPQSSEMSAIRLDAKAVGVAVGDCENDSLYDPYENTCRDLGITLNFQTASKALADLSQKYLYIVLNILSLLSLLMFVCFLVRERKRLKPSVVAKISLLAALVLAQGSQIFGDVSSSPVMCKVSAVGKLLFSLVALITVTVIMRYLMPASDTAILSKCKVAAHLAGPWALAILVVTALLVVDLLDDLVNFVIEYDQGSCWFDNSVQAAILLGVPAAVFTLISCCCLAVGFVAHRRTHTSVVQFACFAEGALLIVLTTGVCAVGVLAVTQASAALDTAFKFSLASLPGVLALVFILSSKRNASNTCRKEAAVSGPDSNQEPDREVAETDVTEDNEQPL